MESNPLADFSSPKFKKLQQKYYEKLKEKGFDDTESASDGYLGDSVYSQLKARRDFKPEIFEDKRDYFIWATHQLETGKFLTSEDRHIWMLYSDGVSTRSIEEVIPRDHSYIAKRIIIIEKYLLEANPRSTIPQV